MECAHQPPNMGAKSSMWQRGRPKVGASENGEMCSYDAKNVRRIVRISFG